MLFGFNKNERLCSQKIIGQLFTSGKSLFYFPFRLVYLPNTKTNASVQIVISVPKKLFKRAVKRNLIKRRIREAYRKQKHRLYDSLPTNYTINMMLIYVAPTILSYTEIENKLHQIIDKLIKDVETNTYTAPYTID